MKVRRLHCAAARIIAGVRTSDLTDLTVYERLTLKGIVKGRALGSELVVSDSGCS
jgi:hypothetical protein